MNVSNYLARIGFNGTARANLATLQRLHRLHVYTVPFENIDVQLGRAVSMDLGSIYDKIVERQRGGWCYELNGLFGWALQQLGFDVIRVSAGVMRESIGDANLGNHLCLLVRLNRPYLVDVGFGSSMIEPLELEETSRSDSPYRVRLREADSGYWRFTEQDRDAPFSYDFKPDVADETLLATKCNMLQSHSTSPFVQNLVAKRRVDEAYLTLRGRVFTRTDALGDSKSLIGSADELAACLHDAFDLDVPEVTSLWPRICARHSAVFGTELEPISG